MSLAPGFKKPAPWTGVHQGEVYAELQKLPSDMFHMCIADPGYGTKLRGIAWDAVPGYGPWLHEAYRVLEPGGICYVFGRPEIIAANWGLFPEPKRLLAWHYTNKVLPKLHFWQPSFDSIVAFSKGRPRFHRDHVRQDYSAIYKKLLGETRPASPGRFGIESSTYADNGGTLPKDVIVGPALIGRYGAAERTEHPTQKPLWLMERLILSATLPGETILDLFAGSGTSSEAASRLGRQSLAIERDPRYCKVITERTAKINAGSPPDEKIRFDFDAASKRSFDAGSEAS